MKEFYNRTDIDLILKLTTYDRIYTLPYYSGQQQLPNLK